MPSAGRLGRVCSPHGPPARRAPPFFFRKERGKRNGQRGGSAPLWIPPKRGRTEPGADFPRWYGAPDAPDRHRLELPAESRAIGRGWRARDRTPLGESRGADSPSGPSFPPLSSGRKGCPRRTGAPAAEAAPVGNCPTDFEPAASAGRNSAAAGGYWRSSGLRPPRRPPG